MKRNIAWFLLAGFLAVSSINTTHAATLTPPSPTFTLEFEGDVNAVGRDGKIIKPRVEGKVEFQDGKFGKAFKSGPDAGYLYYPVKDIVSPESGTIEMWVMPMDWSGNEQAFHSFFRTKGEGEIHLYKYFAIDVGILLLTDDGQRGSKSHESYSNVSSWKPGQWHYIAATWSAARQEVYIDGQLKATTTPLLPRSLSGEFLIGDHFFNPAIPRTSHSLIDNVRIYDRALAPEVIAAHFAGDYKKTAGFSDKTATLDYSVDRAANKLTATLTLQGADVNTQETLVDFLIMQDEKTVAQQVNNSFRGTLANADFPTTLPPGKYVLRATVHGKDEQLGAIDHPLIIPSTEWMNNDIGKEKKVLSPWTPLDVQKNANGFSIKSWGREYHFGSGLMPLQIKAMGESLLQNPIELKVLFGGQQLKWTKSHAQLKDAAGYEANIVGSAEAVTPRGLLRAESAIHIEYDGLMWLSVKLHAPPNFKPDSVTLDIPMREKNAIYRHSWSGNSGADYLSGALPEGTGIIQQNVFQPLSWLGDNDRGLFWFCETAQQWPNWKNKDAFQLRRENGVVTTRLELLHGQEFPANWNFEFGLQATPVKPMPKDWRKWRFAPAPNPNAVVPWPRGQSDYTSYFGYPEAFDPAQFQGMLDKYHAQGEAVVPYLLLNGLASNTPEWKWFGSEWDLKSDEKADDNTRVHHMPPTIQSWQDFVIWKTKQFVDRFKFDGIYHDLSYAYGWAIPSANTGWFDGQHWQKTYPIRAYRELYRRNYAVVKEKNSNSFLWAHNSPIMLIPVLAYEDAYLTGEVPLIDLLKGKDSYMDVMGLDEWRAGYTGKQWGVIPFLLPEFDSEHRKQIQPTRGLAALVMLHGTNVWPDFSNRDVWKQTYDALNAFGYADAEFIPYWAETPLATTNMKDVYVSVYKKKDGQALVIIGNTSKEERSGSVKLNAKAIGMQIGKVLSWPDKKPITQKDNGVEVTIPGSDYQMIWISSQP